MHLFIDKIDVVKNWIVTNGLNYLLRFCGAILVFIIGRWIASMLARTTERAMRRTHLDETVIRFLGNCVNLVVLVSVIVASLGLINVQTNSIVAVIGAAGLAVGLALQGSLSNFAAGLLIVFFRPFRVGDYITAANTAGTVEEISIFTTYLRSPENRTVIVPNALITANNIVNYTTGDSRRLEFKFNVPHTADLDETRKKIQDVIAHDSHVQKSPAPSIGVSNLTDANAEITVWVWAKPADEQAVRFALNEAFRRELLVPKPAAK